MSPDPLHDASRPGAVRIQRALADAGVASRRKSEELILDGLVRVNGEVVDSLPAWVCPEEDHIDVDGKPLPRKRAALKEATRHIYIMLYKPGRTVSTSSDPAGRRTVVGLVQHPSGARLYPVGRLDFDTIGLILLTNDGELANKLTHPRYGIHKTYRATVKGLLDEEALRELEEGVYLAERREGKTVGAKRTAHVELRLVKRDRERTIVDVTLREGRNRQVRRMFAGLGHPVKKLVRIGMGPLELKGVAMGEWRELTRDEVRALRKAAKGIASRVEETESPTGLRPRPRNKKTRNAAGAGPGESPRSRTPARNRNAAGPRDIVQPRTRTPMNRRGGGRRVQRGS